MAVLYWQVLACYHDHRPVIAIISWCHNISIMLIEQPAILFGTASVERCNCVMVMFATMYSVAAIQYLY